MNSFQDAFISYGRPDSKQFVKRLNEALINQGLTVWLDHNSTLLGMDYQSQINRGIENADNFIFIITPHSINSPYCRLELELARKYRKRIVPILHVEEVSRDTWQQRNPDGTDADWDAYCAEGRHSSFANMHLEISKISWISYREGQDTFESALADLLQILQQNQDYVRQHTLYLTRGLKWTQNQKQKQYLLTDEVLQSAESWLGVRDRTQQSLCGPTDLQCEFICESIKQAEDGLTKVFLAYADCDRTVGQQLSKTLLRNGFTLWTKDKDVPIGSDLATAVDQGVEEADNLVVLISPESLQDPVCLRAMRYSDQLNNRIFPLLIADIGSESLPTAQQLLNVLDFRDYKNAAKYQSVADSLLNGLNTDKDYYNWHKQIIVSALRWDRKGRPKSLLLRPDRYAEAEHWLQQRKQRDDLPEPLPIQLDFLTASEAINQFFDAFISYGRSDSKAFAFELHSQLNAVRFKVWFDQHDIPLGVDFQEQINAGIEKAHNFLFVISPHSVNSPYCRKEIELALTLNKRIIPLLHVEQIDRETWQRRNPRQIEDTDWEAAQDGGEHASYTIMHPDVGKINWVYFREHDDTATALNGLIKLLHQHEDYVKEHTEILAKALTWERHQKQDAYLLVGDERAAAEAWLRTRFADQPPPCIPLDLHCEYITESIKNSNNLMTHVFLCHADVDREIEAKVLKSLARNGFTVWSNQRDIDTGIDFQESIDRGIEAADNIIYLMSEHSLKSAYCLHELTYAISLNKRIIPLTEQ